jgi:hypothetical protein
MLVSNRGHLCANPTVLKDPKEDFASCPISYQGLLRVELNIKLPQRLIVFVTEILAPSKRRQYRPFVFVRAQRKDGGVISVHEEDVVPRFAESDPVGVQRDAVFSRSLVSVVAKLIPLCRRVGL